MKLEGKRSLVARTLRVGKGRIVFNKERLPEIKEAITKQDIKDLKSDGAIMVDEVKGKRKVKGRKTRRREGSIKKKVNKGKEKYMTLTRKLRAYLKELKKQEKISLEDYRTLRKEIRASSFRSKAHMKERISLLGTDIKFKAETKKKTKKKVRRKKK